MPSFVVRERLVVPTAVVLALSAVTVAPLAASSPRLAEVSAIRLQAEVTTLVGGIADTTVAAPASAPAAAAATASALGDPWPSTFLDKLVASLPQQIQSIVLPPLYVVMTVVGAVMGVFYLIFGFPKDLMPAAAVAPARGPAAAATVRETVDTQNDSGAMSATPGVDRTASPAAAGDGARDPSATPTARTRGRHPAPVAVGETTVGTVADVAATMAPPTGVVAPKPIAAEAHPAASSQAVVSEAPAVDIADEEPAAPAADTAPTAVNHPARARARSAGGAATDSTPARTARRSAQ